MEEERKEETEGTEVQKEKPHEDLQQRRPLNAKGLRHEWIESDHQKGIAEWRGEQPSRVRTYRKSRPLLGQAVDGIKQQKRLENIGLQPNLNEPPAQMIVTTNQTLPSKEVIYPIKKTTNCFNIFHRIARRQQMLLS